MKAYDVVIVGSGHGGAQAAIALRQAGHEGTIAMVGRDTNPPYERPPLSKDYLAGTRPFEKLLIRPETFWDARGIDRLPGTGVTAIDPAARTVTLSRGESLGYAKLIWAGGGDARRLSCPGADLAGIHAIRGRRDTDALRADLAAGARRAVIVGGGYIGLEAAAVLREGGLAVTVIEREDRLLSRVAGKDVAAFYAAEHAARGVAVLLGAEIERIEGEAGRVAAVVLAGGTRLPCDVVVAGIGIVPAVGPLIAAGAAGSNGVDVDEYMRTSLDDVFAVGDCAAHANPYAGNAVIRLESVQNAHDMASVAARTIMGERMPYDAVPWFWSNQYDLRLQTVGVAAGHDSVVLRGDVGTRRFSVVYLREGRVAALDCVNQTRDYAQGRRLVEARAVIDPALLADATVPLKELL